MANIANQIIAIRFVGTTVGSIIPCVGNSHGIGVQARAGATFDLPISISYYSGGRLTTVQATVPVKEMQYVKDIDPMTEQLETEIQGARPDPNSQATCTVQITTLDPENNNQLVVVTNTTTTVVPVQFQ